MPPEPHRIVLLGAGHAHLEVVRRADELRAVGAAVTLVDPGDLWYSGLASAIVGGRVDPERDRVDVAAHAAAHGVAHHRARAVGLDADARTVTLDDGTTLPWDTCSVNVGSELDTTGLDVDLDASDVVGVKPIVRHVEVRDRVLALLATGDARVTIVGGGASAVEYACNIARLRGEGSAHHRPRVTLVTGAPEVVPPAPAGARARLTALLRARGVTVVTDTRVHRVADGRADLTGVDGLGGVAEHDLAIVATGLRAGRAVAELGLGDADGMPTGPTLECTTHPGVFGAGDAIRFGADGLPRLGVYGVRQAPVLVDNLIARASGAPLRPYEPQAVALAVLDLGGGTALAMRGDRWHEGRLALVLKRYLDERWLRRYRT